MEVGLVLEDGGKSEKSRGKRLEFWGIARFKERRLNGLGGRKRD